MIKSPLRYPGGKSRAIKYLIDYIPETFTEFREPLVGGGSMFIYLKQKNPNLKIWINDLNEELYLFWVVTKYNLLDLTANLTKIKNNCKNGKDLFKKLTTVNVETLSDLDRATRFFILNRITFSGTIESGGYSQAAFETRFTPSSIKRLEYLKDVISDVQITNLDYQDVVAEPGTDTFMFLDPPYYSNSKSKLYGKKGDLHLHFDHNRFAKVVQESQHKWMITYDNSDFIQKTYQNNYIKEWELQYGMNNYQKTSAAIGKELLITNYFLSP